MLVDNGAQPLAEGAQPYSEVIVCLRSDHTMGDPGQALAIDVNDAPSGPPQAGINAQDTNHLAHRRSLADIERIENMVPENGREVNATETKLTELQGHG